MLHCFFLFANMVWSAFNEDMKGRSPLPIDDGEGTPVVEATHKVEPALAGIGVTVDDKIAAFDSFPPLPDVYPLGPIQVYMVFAAQ